MTTYRPSEPIGDAQNVSTPLPTRRPDTIGFIGLGAMGQPMTSTLLNQEFPVIGYDIDADAKQRFARRGGNPAQDIAAVVRQARVVVTSLPSFAAVQRVTEAIVDACQRFSVDDLVLVESSTLTLEQKHAVRIMAATAGIEVYDCPVSGTSAQAAKGDLIAYLSGPQGRGVAEVQQVMSAICRATYWMGEYGNGVKTKLVANLLVAVHNVVTAEALLLARRAGLDVNQVLDSIGDGAGSSRMWQVRGPLMASGEVEHATARVDLFQKDIAAIRQLAQALDSPTPMLDASARIYDRAADAGMFGHDAAAVYCVLDEDLPPEAVTVPRQD